MTELAMTRKNGRPRHDGVLAPAGGCCCCCGIPQLLLICMYVDVSV